MRLLHSQMCCMPPSDKPDRHLFGEMSFGYSCTNDQLYSLAIFYNYGFLQFRLIFPPVSVRYSVLRIGTAGPLLWKAETD